MEIPDSRTDSLPSFPMHLLGDEAALGTFIEAIDWALDEMRAAPERD